MAEHHHVWILNEGGGGSMIFTDDILYLQYICV